MSGHRSTAKTLLRDRKGAHAGRVSYAELFFDLVFVFAVTQLSHLLIEDFTPIGALHTLMLLLAVWWVWVYTVWVTNWLDPEKLPVRFLLLGLMLVGMVMSASVPHAFAERGLVFALAYPAIQVGRSLFFIWAVRREPEMLLNFQRIITWQSVAAIFWLAGGFQEGNMRLALWSAALFIDSISPSTGYWVPGLGRSSTADWKVEGGHIAERCGLFIIIALGESLLVTGATFSQMSAWEPTTLAAFAITFSSSLIMWWLYFDAGADFGSEKISRSHDPGRLARLAYTYIHLLLVAGIVVAAVSDEFVLHHPLGHNDLKTAISVLGGPALFVLGNLLFKWSLTGRFSLAHLLALAALGVLCPFALHCSPLILIGLATAFLLALAIWSTFAARRLRKEEYID